MPKATVAHEFDKVVVWAVGFDDDAFVHEEVHPVRAHCD